MFKFNNSEFIGKIKSVCSDGTINILKKNGKVQNYNFDEVKMIY